MTGPEQHAWGYPLWGEAQAAYTPTSDKKRVPVKLRVCDGRVPLAPENVIGLCTYYYRPLHKEYIDKSGVPLGDTPAAAARYLKKKWHEIRDWSDQWNPWSDHETSTLLLDQRTELIPADPSSPDWSRHANFMMRHIGCGHKPPSYYVSYGYFYCSRYGNLLRPQLTTKGQAWLDKARNELQRNMENGLGDNMDGDHINVQCRRYPNRSVHMQVTRYKLEISNTLFKTFAFNTHPASYLDAGLADLPMKDLLKITAEPDYEDWFTEDTARQIYETGTAAAPDMLRRGKDWAERKLKSARDNAEEMAQDAGEAIEKALNRLMQKFQ